MEPIFDVGKVFLKPGVTEVLGRSAQDPDYFLEKHVLGDWGSMPPRINEEGLRDRTLVCSIYKTLKGDDIRIITFFKTGETIVFADPTTLPATGSRPAVTDFPDYIDAPSGPQILPHVTDYLRLPTASWDMGPSPSGAGFGSEPMDSSISLGLSYSYDSGSESLLDLGACGNTTGDTDPSSASAGMESTACCPTDSNTMTPMDSPPSFLPPSPPNSQQKPTEGETNPG